MPETPTMDEAVRQTRLLIGQMANAIKNITGSSSDINGQDIPNEIRGILGQSRVTKTYYDVNHYLSDIGTILKRGYSRTINAQDFPQEILNLDDANMMYTDLLQWNKLDSTILTLQDFKSLYNRANTEYGKGHWNLYATYATRYGYDSYAYSIGAVPNTVDMVYGENGYNQGTWNSYGNTWYPLGQGSGTYECVSMYKWKWNGSSWSSWLNKDDTIIGSDNYFQGSDYGWDKYAIYNDTKIVAPNGYRYNYKNTISAAAGIGSYNYYTDNAIFVCEDCKTGNGNYRILSLLKTNDNVNTLIALDTQNLGGYNTSPQRMYPSSGSFGGYNKVPAASYGQNEATCPYNWSSNLTPQEVSDQNITIYSTMEEAYKALTGKYYAPNGNLYDYKYTWYATFTHTAGTAGADIWADYKLGATPSISNNCVIYWDEQNYMSGTMYGIPDCNSGTNKEISNTHKNDYYVQTGSLSNQSMAIATPGVYPYATLTTNIPSFSTRGELIAYLTDQYVLTTVDSATYTGYELDVRSEYPFFFITSTPSSRTDVYTAVKGSDNVLYICKILLISGSHSWQPDDRYPSRTGSVTFSNNYYETTSGGTMSTSNRTLGGTPTNYPTLQVFADFESAYAYLMNL